MEEGGRRRGAEASRGLRRAGGRRSGAGDLDGRAAAAEDNEGERAGQGGDRATLLLSYLVLGFETCFLLSTIAQ